MPVLFLSGVLGHGAIEKDQAGREEAEAGGEDACDRTKHEEAMICHGIGTRRGIRDEKRDERRDDGMGMSG